MNDTKGVGKTLVASCVRYGRWFRTMLHWVSYIFLSLGPFFSGVFPINHSTGVLHFLYIPYILLKKHHWRHNIVQKTNVIG